MEEERLGWEAAERLQAQELADFEKQRAESLMKDANLSRQMSQDFDMTEAQRKRQQEVLASAANYSDAAWDIILARLQENPDLSSIIFAVEFNDDDFAARMVELVNTRRKELAEQRAQERRDRPMTPSQLRQYMRTYVKNQGPAIYSTGWTMAQVRKLTPEQLQEDPKTRASSKKHKTGGDDVNLVATSPSVPQEEAGATHSLNVSQEEVAATSHSQDIPDAPAIAPSTTTSIVTIQYCFTQTRRRRSVKLKQTCASSYASDGRFCFLLMIHSVNCMVLLTGINATGLGWVNYIYRERTNYRSSASRDLVNDGSDCLEEPELGLFKLELCLTTCWKLVATQWENVDYLLLFSDCLSQGNSNWTVYRRTLGYPKTGWFSIANVLGMKKWLVHEGRLSGKDLIKSVDRLVKFPAGKDIVLVSTGSTKAIPTGRTILFLNIVLNGYSRKRIGRDPKGNIMILPPVSVEEHIAVQRETKARTILLQSLPEDHMADFHHLDDARDIWLAVKARFREGLHKGYDRFQKILSQLNQMQAKPDNEDCNMKFLRALPLSWSQVPITLKTKGGLDYLSFDDLYNKLRTLEIDVKGGSSYDTHSAFVSATSTNSKMTYPDQSHSTTFTTALSIPVASSNVIESVLHSFVAESDPQQQITYEDFDQIGKMELEELDIKWQMVKLVFLGL
ncbi:hypothetical protein Tco_0039828 [Tanacetum coccineum]